MLPEVVRKFAKDEIGPRVREMDEKQRTDAGLAPQLFSLGPMGIEIPVEYGGVDVSFLSAIFKGLLVDQMNLQIGRRARDVKDRLIETWCSQIYLGIIREAEAFLGNAHKIPVQLVV